MGVIVVVVIPMFFIQASLGLSVSGMSNSSLMALPPQTVLSLVLPSSRKLPGGS